MGVLKLFAATMNEASVYHTTSTEMFDLNSCTDNTSQSKTTGRSTTLSVVCPLSFALRPLPVGGYLYYISTFYYP